MELKGLFTAIITPFDDQDRLNEKGLRQNLRFQLQHGVDGIVVLGTTGETPTLTTQEKERVIQIAFEEIKGRSKLIVGTGSYSTLQTIEQTQRAEQLGADSALIVTPYYNKPTQEGLYRHFKAICKETSLPICLYNIQGRTGQNIQTDTLKRLADLPNVIGVKEASGNVIQMNEVLESISNSYSRFKVVSGDDILTLPLLALGGHGVISVVSNLVPKPIKRLVEAGLKGDFHLARHLHYQLLPLFRAAFIETNPIPIKTAMNLSGMAAGHCRLPLCDLLPDHFQKLKAIVETLPLEWIS
jgi:4-hydroxy-tetrahydrodipicolinate synthase